MIPAPTGKLKWDKYTVPKDIRVGISDPKQGYGLDVIQSMDRFTGRKTSVVNIFIRLDDASWSTKVRNIVAAGYVPMITVEPWLNLSVSDIQTFWNVVSTVGPCYVRYGHEMNGTWYPWGNLDPAVYLSQWSLFFTLRTPNASRVWCVNNGDVGSHTAEVYYPGDSNVDLIGIDGYNRNNGQTPAQVFDPMLTRLRKITNLPLGICEVGTPNGATKGQWITQLYDYVVLRVIAYVAWFNEDKELSWGLFGQSGGNTIFEGHNGFVEYPAAMMKLDSRYF